MSKARVSIRTLGLIVALMALDCGLFRLAFLSPTWGAGPWLIGALGFINVLALAGYRLATRRGPRAFLLGFVAVGSGALVGFVGFGLVVPQSWSHRLDEALGNALMAVTPLRRLADQVDQDTAASAAFVAIAVVFFNLIVSVPLALVALAGGWLCGRSSKAASARGTA